MQNGIGNRFGNSIHWLYLPNIVLPKCFKTLYTDAIHQLCVTSCLQVTGDIQSSEWFVPGPIAYTHGHNITKGPKGKSVETRLKYIFDFSIITVFKNTYID